MVFLPHLLGYVVTNLRWKTQKVARYQDRAFAGGVLQSQSLGVEILRYTFRRLGAAGVPPHPERLLWCNEDLR
jgi:hypothetical protein